MLMDLFYNTLPAHVKRKRRVHFHSFMIDVHKRIHAAKKALGHAGGDPIEPVARDLASDAYVLCFDEFQVRCQTLSLSEQLFIEGIGYGYRRCDDPAATFRTPAELWRRLRHNIEVSSHRDLESMSLIDSHLSAATLTNCIRTASNG